MTGQWVLTDIFSGLDIGIIDGIIGDASVRSTIVPSNKNKDRKKSLGAGHWAYQR